MRTLRQSAVAVCLAMVVAAPGLAAAAEPPSERERAEEMARDAIDRLMKGLDLLIESIPQYEMPEINENGDIIIRRKRGPEPEKPDVPKGMPEIDSTKT